MTLTRRFFLTGAAALIAAPAVIRTAGLLMPVRKVIVPEKPSLLLQEKLGDQWVTVDQVINQDDGAFVDVIGDARRSMVHHRAYSHYRNRLIANDSAYQIAIDQFNEASRYPGSHGPAVGMLTLNGIPLVTA